MSLRHALLGFLSLRPLTGYDLKKLFDGTVRHFWTADQAQIYRTLVQLGAEGLADVSVVPQDGRPARKEHRLTAAGQAALRDWLSGPTAEPPVREAFLIKVFFGAHLTAEELRTMLDDRIGQARERLSALRAVAAAHRDAPPRLDRLLRLATVENGIRHIEVEIEWLEALRVDVTDPDTGMRRILDRIEAGR
ncbi:PadR family transcriptional regulator [Rhizohabitans arisaemae]|uniref:PadR family transcriptional regulator n=1 Tax=Rhizohabitans arisaemae TaxID=2720610 RepID=UPI0024B14309|nr:PadR family transcriptional regulator [Rhizohabitans arisaemae]